MNEQWRRKAQSLRQWRTLANVARATEESEEFLGALLCGSLATGTADELSDIDLIVVTPNERFKDAWAARSRLRGGDSLVAWDEMHDGFPQSGAHKWVTRDVIMVECLIAAPSSGVRLAEPYVVIAGDDDIASMLEGRPPISRSEMGATASEVENRYDAFKMAVREARKGKEEAQ